VEGSKNLNSLFFIWWYTEVFRNLFAFSKHFFAYLADLFSAGRCIATFFSPWKRDAYGYEGLTIQQRFQVLVLNLTSRCVGAFIKLFTLITFCIVTVVCFLFFVGLFLCWALYPLILIGLAVWGIKILLIN